MIEIIEEEDNNNDGFWGIMNNKSSLPTKKTKDKCKKCGKYLFITYKKISCPNCDIEKLSKKEGY